MLGDEVATAPDVYSVSSCGCSSIPPLLRVPYRTLDECSGASGTSFILQIVCSPQALCLRFSVRAIIDRACNLTCAVTGKWPEMV